MAKDAGAPAILQVLPALVGGGVERGTIDLARFLVREGYRVIVASSGGPMIRELVGAGALHVELPLASKNPWVVYRNIRRLQQVVRRHRVSLVHARSRAPAWSAWHACRRARIPFVTTVHGVHSGNHSRLKRRYNAIMTKGERVIAISEFVAEHVQQTFGVGLDRLRTIQRGVSLEELDPERVRGIRIAKIAERLGIEPDGKQVVLLPGRVTRIKGHLFLLRAIARMERRDFLVVFVGGQDPNSGYARQIQALVRATGLGEMVRFAGACDDMPAAYQLADVVVAPSIGPEAFGRVAVEAQAMGKPVIVTNIGGLPETVMPASTGWLVPPDDPDELAWALDRALSLEPAVRERAAQRAREFVARHYDAEQMCRRTLAVYEELIEPLPRTEHEPAIEQVA
jgi:glycosyltransferase involved in cell wall biosynthesis